MKKPHWQLSVAFSVLIFSIVSLFFNARPAYSERNILAPGKGVTFFLDTSSTNLPATYGASANQLKSSLSGKSHIAITNTSSTDIAISVTGTTANCTGATDNAIIPASGSATFENFNINTVVCARSLGSTISTGKIEGTIW